MNITFDMFVSAASVPIVAAIITAFVALLKGSFGLLDARVSGATMAFVTSAVLYVVTAFALHHDNPTFGQSWNDYLNVFLAWLAVGSASVGIKETFSHVQAAPAKSQPLTELIPDDLPPDALPPDAPPPVDPAIANIPPEVPGDPALDLPPDDSSPTP